HLAGQRGPGARQRGRRGRGPRTLRRRGGVRGGARARGAAPVEAAQQGRRRRAGPVPHPRLTPPTTARGCRRERRGEEGYPRAMARLRFRYSPWDGTQKGFELDALDVMEQLTDDLLYHGDLNAALRRMMQQGFEDRNGERIEGLREMLERIRRRREETLERYDLGGVYSDIAEELRDVVATERAELERQVEEAAAS